MSPPTITTPAPAGGGAATPTPITAAIHRDIIQTHILNRLDGPTLASTSCASSQLLALCRDEHLWRDICNATWPSTTHPLVSSAIASFPSGHRSFYSDSFPATKQARAVSSSSSSSAISDYYDHCSSAQELISAVDIFYDDELIYSKVLVTETHSPWFLGTPFRVDLLDPKEVVSEPLKFNFIDNDHNPNLCSDNTSDHRRLRLSWILINPSTKRAVNVASREALEVSRHWLSTDELQVRYATEMGGRSAGGPVLCSVLVACGGGDDSHVRVREVSLQLEDMDGKIVPGRDGLVILNEAMEGQRRKITDGEMERNGYEMFLKTRSKYRERKMRREKSLDMVCVAMEVLVFLAICVLFLRRNS